MAKVGLIHGMPEFSLEWKSRIVLTSSKHTRNFCAQPYHTITDCRYVNRAKRLEKEYPQSMHAAHNPDYALMKMRLAVLTSTDLPVMLETVKNDGPTNPVQWCNMVMHWLRLNCMILPLRRHKSCRCSHNHPIALPMFCWPLKF